MTYTKTDATTLNLKTTEDYLNRELSWLAFNYRVLHEGIDDRTPLLERLKFLAIFSSNLDEYFMVRVAALKQQVNAEVTKLTLDGRTPSEQLEEINENLRPLVKQQTDLFENVLKQELEVEGIYLTN